MPEWDYKALAFFLSLANSLGLVAAVIHTNLTNRQKVNSAAIRQLNERVSTDLNGIDDRLIKVEKSVEYLPTHVDIAKLNRRTDEVAQELRKLEGTIGQMNNSVQLIHKHLLNSPHR